MKKIWQNYKTTLILILATLIGVLAGLIFKEQATVVKPLGDLFLNLLFIVIVPLIFVTISTSIAKMQHPKRLGKIFLSIIGVFIITSLVAVAIGLVSTRFTDLVKPQDSQAIKETLASESSTEEEQLNILERTVNVLSVDDFPTLISRNSVVALVVASILFGFAMRLSSKSSQLLEVLLSLNDVIMQFIKLIMYYAPIGIACYMASFIGTFGSSIALGYLRTFIIYTLVSVLFFFLIYSLYALIAGGKRGFLAFWQNILPPTFTSLATCSSAACIPVNVEAAKKIGVSQDIAETLVPLGTSFHKDGSIIGSVFKIMFLVNLFGTNINSTSSIFHIIFVALIANLLVIAVPVGGGTISESLIISMMGYPMSALPILTVIATIIDAPATVLNVVGDTASSMLVARSVDGQNWQSKNATPPKCKN